MSATTTYSEPLTNSLAKDAAATAEKANGLLSNASHELHYFLADVEDLVKDTSAMTGEDLKRVKAKLSAGLESAKASATEMSGAVAKRSRQAAKDTDDYVHDQPWKAIGTGAVVGLLVGFILARR